MATPHWPGDCLPRQLSLRVRTLTGRFVSRYTGQGQVLARPGARWAAELDVRLARDEALVLEAFLAAVRGPALPFLFPDLLRDGARGSLKSMDAFAAEIGVTDFDDDTGFDDGHVFYEGDGVPSVRGGRGDRIALDGFAPFTAGVLLDGDPMQLGPGRAHLALGIGTTDVNGYVAITITPRLRERPSRGPLVTSGITILMRLADDGAAENPTERMLRPRHGMTLVEAVNDSVVGPAPALAEQTGAALVTRAGARLTVRS